MFTNEKIRKGGDAFTNNKIGKNGREGNRNRNPEKRCCPRFYPKIKNNTDASSTTMNEFGKKIELSFEQNKEIRLGALEAKHMKAWRDEERSETETVEEISPGGDNVFPSRTIRVRKNATINAKLPRGGWLKNPFEEIRFFGRTDKQNPIRFLRRFERTTEYEGVGETDRLHFFSKCLQDAASTWFEVSESESMEEAREMFIRHF